LVIFCWYDMAAQVSLEEEEEEEEAVDTRPTKRGNSTPARKLAASTGTCSSALTLYYTVFQHTACSLTHSLLYTSHENRPQGCQGSQSLSMDED
jgi:hypothetical protein